MKEAMYYSVFDAEKKIVQCELCPHKCRLLPDKTGLCRIRKNIDGKLVSLVYGQFTSINLDPIEKKPLYHFYPGTDILSVGTIGCNFRCLNCQNWEISQADYDERLPLINLSSDDALKLAKKHNSIGIAYTYNEPFINYEWILETAELFRKNGLKNIFVSNGYINETPLMELVTFIDAANIDVKAFNNEFYTKICSAKLEPVLKTVEFLVREQKHIEITYLVIPKYNDSMTEIQEFTDWLSQLNSEIPLHFSRYYPNYKMSENATSLTTLERAQQIAAKKLKYVYLGNVWEKEYNRTYCPVCNSVLVDRIGYTAEITGNLKDGSCRKCGTKINIVM
jgi:pyruvate formate lyase activating enzyme